jgi:hypothetical protein
MISGLKAAFFVPTFQVETNHCMKFTPIILLFLLVINANNMAAQSTDADQVKAVINGLFTAMKNADSVAVENAFTTGAIMETIAKTRQQSDTIRSNSTSQFASSIKRQPAGALDERIEFGSILIDGNLAHVWTPYKFYFNGNFSHCGVNSFELVKLNGAWKIRYLIDTRRKENCN